MKRLTFCMACLFVVAIVGSAWAGQDKISDAPQKAGIALDLDDGSHIIGISSIETVPVQTSYAKMDIQLKQILTIKIEEDHETAAIDLRNGDKIKGVISVESITLETIFGTVKVGVEHIKRIDVVLPGRSLPETLNKGLVLYYSFDRDEYGKVTDKSDKGEDGKVHGAKWTAKGKQGGAYEFNGNGDYIDTLHNFSGMDEITVCGWSFFTSPPADSSVVTEFGEGSSEDVWGLFAGANGKGAQVNVCNADGNEYYFSGNAWELNTWKHLCLTFARGKALTLYENGVLVKSIPVSARSLRYNPKFTAKVGASQGADGYWGSGLIDEVMIFDHALSETEVKQVYDAKK